MTSLSPMVRTLARRAPAVDVLEERAKTQPRGHRELSAIKAGGGQLHGRLAGVGRLAGAVGWLAGWAGRPAYVGDPLPPFILTPQGDLIWPVSGS